MGAMSVPVHVLIALAGTFPPVPSIVTASGYFSVTLVPLRIASLLDDVSSSNTFSSDSVATTQPASVTVPAARRKKAVRKEILDVFMFVVSKAERREGGPPKGSPAARVAMRMGMTPRLMVVRRVDNPAGAKNQLGRLRRLA
ncbi:hypothetical protein [Polyangium mundeleinium]|uniref:Uncharacterized protein n=1 Tax=Polyangium mundeleinium TaxID=2995306 RepID=A0ABT5EPQ0_9BACT|nr:hypothetical protein [Polyangium mundeleinium]MDC0743309.1 hypothetical protein [Polyangium mundeleinium]